MAFNELAGPMQWIVAGGFWRTLGICLFICPVVPQVLGLVFCSYWAPWNLTDQFYAYIPGNPCLALFIAGTSTTFEHGHVHVAMWLNITAMVAAFGIYVVLTFVMDWKAYTRGQFWSANKVYHNLLYFWYGYLAFTCFTGMIFWTDASVVRKIVVSVPGVFWVWCGYHDATLDQETLQHKLRHAHADTCPLWRTGFRLRQWTPQGYRLFAA